MAKRHFSIIGSPVVRRIFKLCLGIGAVVFVGLILLWTDLQSQAPEPPETKVCRSNVVFCLSRIEQWTRETQAYSSLPLREGNSLVFTKYLVHPPQCPSGLPYRFGQSNGLVVCPVHDVRVPLARTRWLGIRNNYGSASSCITALKQIEGSIETWSLETKNTGIVTMDGVFLTCITNLQCPSGGVYLVSTCGERPRCTQETLGYHQLEQHPSYEYRVSDRLFNVHEWRYTLRRLVSAAV